MAKKRANGEGTVRKRKDGRWEGFITVGHKNNGKPIIKSVCAKTQRELLPKLHKLIDDYRGVELTEESYMTVREWLEKWMHEYVEINLRPGTVRSYRIQCDKICKYVGDKQVGQLTSADCQRMYNTMKKNGREVDREHYGEGLADSTVRSIHLMFHEAMDAALRKRLIASNPTEGTVIPKNNYKEKQVLNDDQLDLYMEAIKKDPLWHDFFYLELTTGLRIGEICGLRWEDFDEKSGTLKIQRSLARTVTAENLVGDPKTEKGKRTIIVSCKIKRRKELRKESQKNNHIMIY